MYVKHTANSNILVLLNMVILSHSFRLNKSQENIFCHLPVVYYVPNKLVFHGGFLYRNYQSQLIHEMVLDESEQNYFLQYFKTSHKFQVGIPGYV